MPSSKSTCPRGHSDGYHVRRDGWATTKDGRRQYFRCIGADGTSHRFLGPLAAEASRTPDGRRSAYEIRCPRPGHKDAVIQSRGTRTTATGTWRRFVCVRPDGNTHAFQMMLSEKGDVVPVSTLLPPPCAEHPGSHVVRAGTYGKRSRRQRYLCRPDDGKAHQFTPALSREAVSPGDACKRCDELLSPHHGPVTAARHTPWPLMGIAQALNDLSLGDSYANVSLALRAQRDKAREHLERDHGIAAFTRSAASVATSTTSYSRKQRRNAWRVAADLVEQYAPQLFAEVDARYRSEAQAQRDVNDAALAARTRSILSEPLVYILDELPIWTHTKEGRRPRPSWNILTVVEVLWREPEDPFMQLERDTRLRLARAFPRSNADAWQLVLAELEVRPDFVVADKGTGLNAALRAFYGPTVDVVPSLWHIHRNLRDALIDLDNTTYFEGKERVLVDPLRKHLGALARNGLVGGAPADIARWWDELTDIVAGLPAPVSTIENLRAIHEPRLAEAARILTANPQVPASNAAVEGRIRNDLKPFLDNRSHMFANQERTNRLLNLLVCRQAGVFGNLDDLALRIRETNEESGGWARAPRQILDKQPPAATSRTKRYASLRSHSVIGKLAKSKGITTAAQDQASAPPPMLSKRRPETIERALIREWARGVGLPAGVTGPIRPSVQLAYDATLRGASDAYAKSVFNQAEVDRLAKNKLIRDKKRTSAAEQQRSKELAPYRQWAKDNGIVLPKNGQIPSSVTEAYDAARTGATHQRRPSKQPKKGSS